MCSCFFSRWSLVGFAVPTLSLSGASVVAEENRYPFFVFIISQIKKRRTKLSFSLAPFFQWPMKQKSKLLKIQRKFKLYIWSMLLYFHTYTLVLWQSSYPSMLVCAFTLVCRVLGQSHINLWLELVAQVAVLETQIQQCQHRSTHKQTSLPSLALTVPGKALAVRVQPGSSVMAGSWRCNPVSVAPGRTTGRPHPGWSDCLACESHGSSGAHHDWTYLS